MRGEEKVTATTYRQFRAFRRRGTEEKTLRLSIIRALPMLRIFSIFGGCHPYSFVTMAAGIAEEAEGDAVRRYMLIGTSEPGSYIRPGVSLNPGEIVVPGELDAEQNVVNFVTNNKLRLIEIGATRPVCPDCVAAIKPTRATITTPLRQW